jgi:urease accessory protein
LNGSLRLRAVLGPNGRTVLAESSAEYPLQVTRARPCASGQSEVVVLLQSGGLLDGDAAHIDVEVDSGAKLALRTQAATQVHRGRSRQSIDVRVAARGAFSYMPQALVPHRGADFLSETHVALDAGACALVGEVLSPGRVEFGELFAYERVQIALDACIAGRLVARERAVLEPNAALRCAQFGPFSHVATAYVLGHTARPHTSLETSNLASGGWFMRGLAHRAADLDDPLSELTREFWRRVA